MRKSLIKKAIKRSQKEYNREKKLCAKIYDDWADNEYNLLHNQFIWAVPYRPDREPNPSFLTLNKAIIYYNRKSKTYFLDIDAKYFMIETREDLADLLKLLDDIDIAFTEMMRDNYKDQVVLFDSFATRPLEGETLAEVYIKWKILFNGYKNYYIEKSLY